MVLSPLLVLNVHRPFDSHIQHMYADSPFLYVRLWHEAV